MEELKKFIINFLSRHSSTSSDILNLITDDESLREFNTAFTHKSLDTEHNYERYEFLGDSIINMLISFHIMKRFPHVNNVYHLTKLSHNLRSNKQLTEISKAKGMFKYVKFSQDILKNENINIVKIYADVFEAFIGVLVVLIDQKTSSYNCSIGLYVAQSLIDNMLAEVNIDIDRDVMLDPVSSFKEICDMNKSLGWSFKTQQEIEKNDDTYTVKLYGWPIGNREANDNNKVLLSKYVSRNKKEALINACRIAIQQLEKYGVKHKSRQLERSERSFNDIQQNTLQ